MKNNIFWFIYIIMLRLFIVCFTLAYGIRFKVKMLNHFQEICSDCKTVPSLNGFL